MLKKEIIELIERRTANAWDLLKWEQDFYGKDSAEAKATLSVWAELSCLESEAKMGSKEYKEREERIAQKAGRIAQDALMGVE